MGLNPDRRNPDTWEVFQKVGVDYPNVLLVPNFRSIEATIELSKSQTAKVVVVGNTRRGLPLLYSADRYECGHRAASHDGGCLRAVDLHRVAQNSQAALAGFSRIKHSLLAVPSARQCAGIGLLRISFTSAAGGDANLHVPGNRAAQSFCGMWLPSCGL